ncbi:MAG: DNA polymerase IV [Phycisphaerae bacterium]|nr:DNA polymerase IV [Phycisphaerae bacterium]
MALRDKLTAIIFHIDIDAFFASVEQVLDPVLRGRPVIVGGRPGDRSVVASASYEARARGVRTAMPIAQACRICPEGVFLRGTWAHYEQASSRVFAICRDFTPVVEPASVDDGYLDMTGTGRLWGLPLATASRLHARVLAETGLNVSIGIGGNRLIARVATDLAKPNGIAWVWQGYEREFLAPMDIEALPGIGRRTAERLRRSGVHRVSDLALLPRDLLRREFGVAGEQLAGRAAGRDGCEVAASARQRRSISRETSFERDEPDRGAAAAMLYYLTERAAWSLRSERLACGAVAVKLRYSDYVTSAGSQALVEPSDRDAVLFAAARGLMERLDTRRRALRLVGVCLEKLKPAGLRQLGLFDEPAARRNGGLLAAQDAIRERFGFAALVTGRSIELLNDYESDQNGFRLRTSCLTR